MSKTPEEMAEEYAAMTTNNLFYREPLSNGFLAGYKAAQEHAHAALEEAEVRIQELQDQLAGVSKVMPDTCEHIVDVSKMVDVSSSATLNNWISVRTRLPDRNTNVLAWIKCGTSEYVFIETASGDPSECSGWKHYNKDQVTHWMPLPEPPKEE
jgi:hypothetical protein